MLAQITSAFGTLMLLVGCQEGHPSRENICYVSHVL